MSRLGRDKTFFSSWLGNKVRKKKKFTSRFKWTMRDMNRWCHGKNIPNPYVMSKLLSDVADFLKEDYSSVVVEACKELQKDYRQKYERKTNPNT